MQSLLDRTDLKHNYSVECRENEVADQHGNIRNLIARSMKDVFEENILLGLAGTGGEKIDKIDR